MIIDMTFHLIDARPNVPQEHEGLRKSSGGGFSLMEMLIAMVISVILLGSIFGVFIIQSRTLKTQEQTTEMIEEVRAAMDLISREIRMAGYNPANASFDGITYSPSEIRIKADLNGNGSLSDADEDIIYASDLENHRITRNTGGGGQPFAENIEAFTFIYLDVNGNSTTISRDIRQIKITITGRTSKPDPAYHLNNGYRTYTLTSLVISKNLYRD